jgi:hypothetical protein
MVTLHWSDFNLFAVFTAWIVHIVMGLVWFSPGLFGKAWSELTGKELKPAKQWVVPGLFGHLLMTFVVLILIKLTNAGDGFGGLLIGLLAWIGFIVPMETGELVWEKIPFKLFLIRIGNHFLGCAVSGFILGAWQ